MGMYFYLLFQILKVLWGYIIIDIYKFKYKFSYLYKCFKYYVIIFNDINSKIVFHFFIRSSLC